MITVGPDIPVCSWMLDVVNAISTRPESACMAVIDKSPELGSTYFSRYRRMVAPDDPVPDNLKTNLDPSWNKTLHPW